MDTAFWEISLSPFFSKSLLAISRFRSIFITVSSESQYVCGLTGNLHYLKNWNDPKASNLANRKVMTDQQNKQLFTYLKKDTITKHTLVTSVKLEICWYQLLTSCNWKISILVLHHNNDLSLATDASHSFIDWIGTSKHLVAWSLG